MVAIVEITPIYHGHLEVQYAIMPMPWVSWTTWAWPPRLIAVCSFFVSIPGITMFQYKCTVHAVFSYGHLYAIFQPTRTKA